MSSPSSTPTPMIITCGIDIGSESTKVVLGSNRYDCEIVRNVVGGHTTPTALSFSSEDTTNKSRLIGATAQIKRGGANAIGHLNRLLAGELESATTSTSTTKAEDKNDPFEAFYLFDHNPDGVRVANYQYTSTSSTTSSTTTSNNSNNTDHDDNQERFPPPAIIAMLLGKIRSQVLATMNRMHSHDTMQPPVVTYLLSVGPDTSIEAQRQLLDAAYAAGMGSSIPTTTATTATTTTTIVESSQCYSSTLWRKFPDHNSHENNKTILICDMGHCQTSITILQLNNTSSDNNTIASSRPKVLASCRHKSLGAGSVDIRLFDHFQQSTTSNSTSTPIAKKSRSGQRLLEGCHKLKQLLSQLPDATVMVENVGVNDADISLSLSRTTLVELCQPEQEALTALIQRTLLLVSNQNSSSNDDDDDDEDATNNNNAQKMMTMIDSVEAVGGGCRIPWVQATILAAVGNTALTTLSHSLDDTSVALGAALIGEQIATAEPPQSQQQHVLMVDTDLTEDCQSRRHVMREAEQRMASLDEEQQIRSNALNQMEAHVLELRSYSNQQHASLLPLTLQAYLDDLEDWLFSKETQEEATKTQVMEKVAATLERSNDMCRDYHNAVRQDTEAKERDMEEEAKQAQLERQSDEGENDGENNKDDHDNRRLPKKRRLEIVLKNKTEANELFAGGNFKFAAARYTKALSHCAKFVDLSPDGIAEVSAIQLSLHLNLALAYLKLEQVDQALRVCNDAMALDDTSTKALYRRASVYYEKKNWEKATLDATKAASLLTPEDDSYRAVQKLLQRIEAQQKRQRQKEKKMAKKMFG